MKRIILLTLIMSLAAFTSYSFAAEHPGQEHPGAGMHKEHPGSTHAAEHPGAEHSGEAITDEQIREAISSYAKKDSDLKGGYFLFFDSRANKPLQLVLERVHKRVSYIKKEDAYFACADFKTADGSTGYDIDFWMKKNADNELDVYKVVVHKKNGKPRFTYQDDEIVPLEPGKPVPESRSSRRMAHESMSYGAPESGSY